MNRAFTSSVLLLFSCLVIWVSVWALLPSRALGQVNGSGPSPSSDFDIVLNLPGDEAIITGADNESIGGTPGQTTQLNVHTGGVIGRGFVVSSGSELNIIGGNVGSFSAESGSVVNISGGNVSRFDALGGEVNISGGDLGGGHFVGDGSRVNIFGNEFRVDGRGIFEGYGGPLEDFVDLVLGQPSTVTARGGFQLSGLLADGTPFLIALDIVGHTPPYDVVLFGASVTVTLTPPAAEPVLLGDCNLDGVVDFEDIAPFIMALQSGSFLEEADCNQDGGVDFEDIGALVAILQSI